MTSDQTKIKTKRTNRTSVFVWVSVFYFPNIGENWSVCFFCFFFFPRKSSLAIHSFDFRAVFFFSGTGKKKTAFSFIHSNFSKNAQKRTYPGKKKIRYLCVSQKCPCKLYFAIFLVFCTVKIMVARPLFSNFLAIFTPTFFLHAHFFFFHGLQIPFARAHFWEFFSGRVRFTAYLKGKLQKILHVCFLFARV